MSRGLIEQGGRQIMRRFCAIATLSFREEIQMRRLMAVVILGLLLVAGCIPAYGVSVAGGFEVNNFIYRTNAFGWAEFLGEITNNSGKDYDMAIFTLSIYSEDKKLIDAPTFIIHNFANGSTVTFGAASTQKLPDKILYKIAPYILTP